jgi:predicted ArsR family transcriptional regulator
MSPAPKIDMKALKQLRQRLEKPRTVEWLSHDLGVSVPTVYRYLKLLVEDGSNVQRVGIGRPTQYRIV